MHTPTLHPLPPMFTLLLAANYSDNNNQQRGENKKQGNYRLSYRVNTLLEWILWKHQYWWNCDLLLLVTFWWFGVNFFSFFWNGLYTWLLAMLIMQNYKFVSSDRSSYSDSVLLDTYRYSFLRFWAFLPIYKGCL